MILYFFLAFLPPVVLRAEPPPDGLADSLYQAALHHMKARRMQAAEGDLRRSLRADSSFYEAKVALSRLHSARRQFVAAQALLEQAMASRPDRVEAMIEFANVRAAQSDREAAIRTLRHAIEVDPGTQVAYTGLARMLMIPSRQMDLAAAAAALDRALELDADDDEALFYRGQVAMYEGRWPRAQQAFDELLARRPDHFATSYQLGFLLYHQGEYGRALQVFERMAQVNPASQLAQWNLWLAAQQLGGYPAAVDTALRIHPVPEPAVVTTSVVLHEIAAEVGLDAVDAGYGSAWLDIEGDGDLDLFALGRFGGTGLFENPGRRGERFIDRAPEMGLDGLAGIGVITGDYDNDGDADLFVTRDGWYGAAPNVLLRNDGPDAGGRVRLRDVATRAGVAGDGSSLTAVWGDLDNDGNLDLVVTNGVAGDGSANRVYIGDGDGGFADVTAAAGIGAGRTVGSTLGDYDNDGDLDLYLANSSQLNLFYRNDFSNGRPGFTDVTRPTRTQLPLGGHFAFFFDYDNDGRLDLFCSEMSDLTMVVASRLHGRTQRDRNRPSLYWNRGDGTFEDRTYAAGLGSSYGTSGAHVGDINGDGFPDIYLANGGAEMTRLEPDALLLNLGDGRFADIAPALGWMQLAKAHGVTFADVDGDGSQELYLPVGGAYPGDQGPNLLLRNEAAGAHWLTLRLHGVRSNRDGIGTRIRALAGGRVRHADVASGGGFGSSNSLQVELGLGSATVVDTLEVIWPSGVVDLYTGLEAGRTIDLVEGEGR